MEFNEESCIWAPTASVAYKSLLRNLLHSGEECSPRGMKVKELRPVMFRIDRDGDDGDLRYRWVGQQSRKMSLPLGILEGLQIIGGFTVPTALVAVAPQYRKFINPADGHLDGAYGPRIIEQVPYIIRILNQDPDTRQAVITIYGPQDHHTSLDIPCTLSLQFFLRPNPAAAYPNGFEFDKFCPLHGRHGSGAGLCICNRWWRCGNDTCGETAWGMHCHMCGAECPTDIFAPDFDSLPNPHFTDGPPPEKALEIAVTMRSNDVWLGVPYDVVQFSMLQAAIASDLEVAVGRYTHIANSMHLYKRDWKKAEALLEDREPPVFPDPPTLGAQPIQKSVDEAHKAVVTWWMERAKKKQVRTDVDPSMFEMIMAQQAESGALSPFFQWCLDELRRGSRNG